MKLIFGTGLAAIAGFVQAHPGHGAPEGHFHSAGWEAGVVAVVVAAVAMWVTRER